MMLRDGASQTEYEAEPAADYEVLSLPVSLPATKGEFLASLSQSAIHSLEHLGDRYHEVFRLQRNPRTYEVRVDSAVMPEDYKPETPERDWGLLEESLEDLKGKKIVFIGATYEGGGVAMIRPPLLNFLNKSGVEAHWGVLEPDEEGFATTKKMHNLQQDMVGPEVEFTEDDRFNHQRLGLLNFMHFNEQEYFQDADYYVIDDPQPAAMIPKIRQHYPNAKIIFRNHIQTDRDKMAREGSQQNVIYKYLHEDCGVGTVDTYVAHPVEDFVPYGTKNVVYMPPTCDTFEDLNRDLTDTEIQAGLDFIDRDIDRQNRERRELNDGSYIDDQEPLDRSRPRIALFARFDPAKGMHIAMELHRRTIEKIIAKGGAESQIPELVIIGNGSVDDKDRAWMLDKMITLRREEYGDIKKYIKVVGMSHNYSAVNALMRTNMFSENPSEAEGFEHRSAESTRKYVPSIVSNRGGLPLQVEDGVNGFVMDFDKIEEELDRVAEKITDSIIYPEQYEALKASTKVKAEEYIKREIGTVSSVIRWARALQGQGDRDWLLDNLEDEEALAA